MVHILETLHNYTFISAFFVLTLEAVILFARSKNSLARLSMAIMLSIWAIGYLGVVIMMNTNVLSDEFVLFREKYILAGSFYISFMALYLMQILIPGWLNWKRFLLVESPFILLVVLFYGGISLLGETIDTITSYAMLFDLIGRFNVWFRFVVLIAELLYLSYMLRWLHRFEKKYIQWQEENFANCDYTSISWIHAYYYIIVGITIFYLGVFFLGGRVPVLFHTVFSVFAFSYLFYKILFYKNPYPSNFFESFDEEEQRLKSEKIYTISNSDLLSSEDAYSDKTFEEMIPVYVLMVKKWLEEERPYLYKDFKLTDVSRLLPLNRSYLSRVFNDGFGHKFSEVVRSYRIAYSKDLIQRNHSLPLYEIARESGFGSAEAFLRAFKIVTGISPNQYKQQCH